MGAVVGVLVDLLGGTRLDGDGGGAGGVGEVGGEEGDGDGGVEGDMVGGFGGGVELEVDLFGVFGGGEEAFDGGGVVEVGVADVALEGEGGLWPLSRPPSAS